jgi:hypothetical protein
MKGLSEIIHGPWTRENPWPGRVETLKIAVVDYPSVVAELLLVEDLMVGDVLDALEAVEVEEPDTLLCRVLFDKSEAAKSAENILRSSSFLMLCKDLGSLYAGRLYEVAVKTNNLAAFPLVTGAFKGLRGSLSCSSLATSFYRHDYWHMRVVIEVAENPGISEHEVYTRILQSTPLNCVRVSGRVFGAPRPPKPPEVVGDPEFQVMQATPEIPEEVPHPFGAFVVGEGKFQAVGTKKGKERDLGPMIEECILRAIHGAKKRGYVENVDEGLHLMEMDFIYPTFAQLYHGYGYKAQDTHGIRSGKLPPEFSAWELLEAAFEEDQEPSPSVGQVLQQNTETLQIILEMPHTQENADGASTSSEGSVPTSE